MALVTTVGSASANSYVSLAEVADYIATHHIPAATLAAWNALANDAAREKLLIQATQLLDRHVGWRGYIFGDAQSLSWPRSCATDRHGRDIETSVVPAFVKEFQIETALWILEQEGEIPSVGSGEFDSIRVGALEIDFNEKGAARRSFLPESVIAALSPMGSYTAGITGGAHSVQLSRM